MMVTKEELEADDVRIKSIYQQTYKPEVNRHGIRKKNTNKRNH